MLTALADGQLFAEKVGGTPPAVIALHGWARTASDLLPIVSGLDALAIQLPGFGVSPEPPIVWGSEDYADQLATAISDFGPVVVLGHSFGGRVAARLASKYPHLVSGLVLTGVPLVRLVPPPKSSLGYRFVRELAKSGLVSQKTLDRQRDKRGSADYRAAHGVMRGVLVRTVGEDYSDDLAAIKAPVRMVWGERDAAAPADAGLAASKLVPDATFRVVPGAEHLLEGPLADAVREELLGLLGGVKL